MYVKKVFFNLNKHVIHVSMLIDHTSCKAGSNCWKVMGAFCGNNAQHNGVENVKQNPVSNIYNQWNR